MLVIDPLIQLSRAIDGALEVAIVPALLLLAGTLVTAAALEIHARARRRRPQPRKKKRTAPRTRVNAGGRSPALELLDQPSGGS
jgi:hypothetical protein